MFVGDDCGTVRFVGSLAGKEEGTVFVGLEWDRPERGSHTGEFGGLSLFDVRPGASASFVRADSPALRSGGFAAEVLAQRYDQSESVHTDLYALTAKEARVAIQLVLDEKTPVLPVEQLVCVSLASSRITHFDERVALRCPLLQELDLSDNSLASLGSVVKHLPPKLRSLNLALNPLFEPLAPGEERVSHVLETLAVAGSQVAWPVLLPVLGASLRCLDLSDCRMLAGTVPVELAARCPALTQLHLNGCLLKDWSSFGECVNRLTELVRLFLSDNPLTTLGPINGCGRLELLAVSNTELQGWDWTKHLEPLCHLRHIRFAGTPCHKEPRSRLRILGLLPQLTMLNGADVSDREKQDADIIRQKELNQSIGDSSSISNGNSNNMARPPLTVRLTATNGKQSPEFAVSPETTVAMLRDMAFRHTGIAPFRQKVWARCALGGEVQRTLLDQTAATLDWYGFVAGLVDVLIEEIE